MLDVRDVGASCMASWSSAVSHDRFTCRECASIRFRLVLATAHCTGCTVALSLDAAAAPISDAAPANIDTPSFVPVGPARAAHTYADADVDLDVCPARLTQRSTSSETRALCTLFASLFLSLSLVDVLSVVSAVLR